MHVRRSFSFSVSASVPSYLQYPAFSTQQFTGLVRFTLCESAVDRLDKIKSLLCARTAIVTLFTEQKDFSCS